MPRFRALAPSVLIAATALAGCSVGPDYTPRSAADLGVPDAYSVTAPPTREDLTRWWTRFNDPMLGSLVEQGAAANTDVAQAVGRLRQAREAQPADRQLSGDRKSVV